MTTSAPIRKIHNIPIKEKPLLLPPPNPDRWIPITPSKEPIREPIKVKI